MQRPSSMYTGAKIVLRVSCKMVQHLICNIMCRGITVTIACPGPVATGTEATPRNVFSSQGLTAKHEERGGSKKRLGPARVAALIARAAYNRLDMCWIAKHPVLLLGELLQAIQMVY